MRVVDVDNIARALSLLGLEKDDSATAASSLIDSAAWLPPSVSTTQPACGATLAVIAPGTSLRDGLERILRGRTGALIVLGHDRDVEGILTGGFTLDVPFTATALRELAKMDGAIVLDRDIARIHRANVHLMPDHTIPSEETGTRHRTADRVAKQTGAPVISVSQSMQIIAIYVGEIRYVLEDSGVDPGPRQPGAGHARALQGAPRRGLQHAVRAGDRGPGHRPRRRRGGPAAGDGQPDRPRDRRLRPRARHRRPAAVPPARGAGHRRRGRARAWWSATTSPAAAARKPAEEVLAELEALSPADLVDIAAVARALGLGQGEHLDGAVTPARLPPARQGPAAAERRRRPAGRALRDASRSCSPPASRTCRWSTASASCAPAASARDSPGWPSPASSSATSEPQLEPRRAVEHQRRRTGAVSSCRQRCRRRTSTLARTVALGEASAFGGWLGDWRGRLASASASGWVLVTSRSARA